MSTRYCVVCRTLMYSATCASIHRKKIGLRFRNRIDSLRRWTQQDKRIQSALDPLLFRALSPRFAASRYHRGHANWAYLTRDSASRSLLSPFCELIPIDSRLWVHFVIWILSERPLRRSFAR